MVAGMDFDPAGMEGPGNIDIGAQRVIGGLRQVRGELRSRTWGRAIKARALTANYPRICSAKLTMVVQIALGTA